MPCRRRVRPAMPAGASSTTRHCGGCDVQSVRRQQEDRRIRLAARHVASAEVGIEDRQQRAAVGQRQAAQHRVRVLRRRRERQLQPAAIAARPRGVPRRGTPRSCLRRSGDRSAPAWSRRTRARVRRLRHAKPLQRRACAIQPRLAGDVGLIELGGEPGRDRRSRQAPRARRARAARRPARRPRRRSPHSSVRATGRPRAALLRHCPPPSSWHAEPQPCVPRSSP